MSTLTKKAARRAKETVVAVSGGFDPIHVGHVRMFQEAKKLGDRLVVILNNDHWLKAKKGYVFMPQEERKEIIEAIAGVDRVVLTRHPENPTDMSVCAELRRLKPDIFANGGDRHQANVPEVPVCAAIGCEMVFNVGRGGKMQSSSWLLNSYATHHKLQEQGKAAATKKIIVFDLDGTLTESKANLDPEMALLLNRLLSHKIVAVIGGGNLPQFKKQFLKHIKGSGAELKNLFIAPTSGASLYRYRGKRLSRIYQYVFTPREKKKIMAAFQSALRQCGYVQPAKIYGPLFEDRQSQITFSALGQKASPEKKKEWNAAFQPLRARITRAMAKRLPGFEVRMGGLTSIDVTRKGIDKVYGISRLLKEVGCSRKDMVYVGDALYKGGNDYVVAAAGIPTIRVNDWKETKDFIRALLASLRVSGK